MAKTSPLHKVTDDIFWNAEGTFGRLCIVAHAAFLYGGFLPHGGPAATTRSLSRSYSLPQRQGEDDDLTVVLRLSRRGRRRGDRGCVVLHAYYDMRQSTHDGTVRRELLDRAAVAAALSGGLDETARALRGQWIWKLLADRICRGLFLGACRRSGVPVEPSFASIPREVKLLILCRLGSAEDIAMAECASKELRDLAAEHDADVWKPKYESLERHRKDSGVWKPRCETHPYSHPNCDRPCSLFCEPGRPLFCEPWRPLFCEPWRPFSCSTCYRVWTWYRDLPNMSWKQRYMRISNRQGRLRAILDSAIALIRAASLSMKREAPTNAVPAHRPCLLLNVVANGLGKVPRRTNLVGAQCNGHKRPHGAGAIHSPSSRYQWRHR
ncbi:unnamed protein product [Urochloa decumbens]|uniref:F-box domain-containing protein n=1 Tax=Urochloa decumbens TaxID=240449 RepID=A0ABC8Y9B2_9POAL